MSHWVALCLRACGLPVLACSGWVRLPSTLRKEEARKEEEEEGEERARRRVRKAMLSDICADI